MNLDKYFLAMLVVLFLAGSVEALGWNSTAVSTTYVVIEDTPYYHNFTVNLTDPVTRMEFVVDTIGGAVTKRNGATVDYTEIDNWIYFVNVTTGIFILNASRDNETGNFSIPIKVTNLDTEASSGSPFIFNITPVNDPPRFLNLSSYLQLNRSLFELILMANDEENDLPFVFNVSFPSCTHAVLNPPTGADNCTLFNLTAYNTTATNISFTPRGDQKGEYAINFSITDARNATYSTLVNWTVTWNEYPYFTYACDNERNTTENSPFTCYINVTDPDELNNITFTSNYSWFTFNSSGTNITTLRNVTLGNFSAVVNLTTTDAQVGNWSINITVRDTGAANQSVLSNSTVFYFYVSNQNDSVDLLTIPAYTAFTSANYTLNITAMDSDLLIPDKSIYNETLTFTTNNTNVSILSTNYISGTNRTNASIFVNTIGLGNGNHSINVTVTDANNFSIDSGILYINITGNNAPQWHANTPTSFMLTEDTAFSYNLTRNVSDSDSSDTFTFSYIINNDEYTSDFPNFPLDISNGMISFTPRDADVGYWNLTIYVSDGKTAVGREFNFTVDNLPDNPSFQINGIFGSNVSVNESGRNITLQEDNFTRIRLQIIDNDFYIQQTSFYDEQPTINVTLQGINSTLFSFTVESLEPGGQPIAQYSTDIFVPRKNDVGYYNVTINVTDVAGLSNTTSYNLTILETGHDPNMTTVSSRIFTILNETLLVDVNATDLEDGNDSATNGNFTFSLLNLTVGGNFLTINSSTGLINFTFNQTYAGKWQYKLEVNDSSGRNDTELFNITVYDYPKILLPSSSYTFNLVENVTSSLNFTFNHTVGEDVNISLYLNGTLRNSTNAYGNGSAFLWNFTANFTDETTCRGTMNFILNVSNPRLSNTTSWSVNINHTNFPLEFSSTIGSISGGSPQSIFLSNYFNDIDASDVCWNQTIRFATILVPNSNHEGSFDIEINDWVNNTAPNITFSTTDPRAVANYSIRATEYNTTTYLPMRNTTSNNFTVDLNVETTNTPVSGGGGGGSSASRIISLKILVPDPVSAKQDDQIVIPMGIVNDGIVDLRTIVLSATVAKDGELRSDLVATFDKSTFDMLRRNDRENVTMIVDIDTDAVGLFEVTINASVRSPKYSDWGKFYIEIEKEEDVLERIIFTEEFIIGNPQCAELADLLNDAKEQYNSGQPLEALRKANDALDACKQTISQPVRFRPADRPGDQFLLYSAIASLGAFILGFFYYQYKKIRLKRELRGY